MPAGVPQIRHVTPNEASRPLEAATPVEATPVEQNTQTARRDAFPRKTSLLTRVASGESGFGVKRPEFFRDIDTTHKCLVDRTCPRKLSFELRYSCAKPAYLVGQTEVVAGTDVAEKGLRHSNGPPR
jgi:hypothetical protein